MLYVIFSLAELLLQFIWLLFCKRYVFLEHGMENRKQNIYFAVCIILIVLCSIFMDDGVSTVLMVIMVGLNISLSRSNHRLVRFFMVLPILGIVNGLAVPVLVMPALVCSFSENTSLMIRLVLEAIITLILVIFHTNNQRKDSAKNVDRYLQNWEILLLCLVGIVMMIFSISMNSGFAKNMTAINNNDVKKQILIIFCLIGGISFTLSITIIALIIQGNKRTFYHYKVNDMQFNMITIMADIVESRDENTGGHIKRTAKYVEIIARKLKQENTYALTEQYISDMVIAAPLHDIGKIHIPDAILNKPGRLTKEEFEIMKGHAQAGRNLLMQAQEQMGGFSYLEIAIDMAAYHHEWWNGNGYPNKPREQEIPLCARIMAVADVFDALTARRCYKDAMTIDKAFGIIREESGTHFDPVVAQAFLDCAKEIEKVVSD